MGDFDLVLVLPVVCLAAYGLLVLLLVPFMRGGSRALALATLIGLGMTGGTLYKLWIAWQESGPLETAFGMVHIDGFGLFFSFMLLLTAILTVIASVSFLEREQADQGEFYALILFCLAGMFLMLHTTHLMVVLIGLEIFSLSLYVITGLTRNRVRSVESALKYFLLGAFSSGFIVYGLALVYGACRSLELGEIAQVAAQSPSPLLWIGLGLVVIGLAFKIALVPFHQWVPDVYQGAPTNVTGFMAAATKTAAFAVLVRVLVGALGAQIEIWGPIATWLAILTMTVANLIALTQTNLKRMLAYSSIAHAGYLMIGIVSRPDLGVLAIMYYLAAYSLMTIGAFTVLQAVGHGDADSERGYSLSEWAGLGWRRPMLGLAMSFFLFSLAGIPPTGGFFGKYVIFRAAIESGEYLLAIVGVVNAGIAAYYYLQVIVTMYMREPETDEQPLPVSPGMATVLVLTVVGVLYLGLAPGRILEIVKTLTLSLI